jgi:hypothetical protein
MLALYKRTGGGGGNTPLTSSDARITPNMRAWRVTISSYYARDNGCSVRARAATWMACPTGYFSSFFRFFFPQRVCSRMCSVDKLGPPLALSPTPTCTHTPVMYHWHRRNAIFDWFHASHRDNARSMEDDASMGSATTASHSKLRVEVLEVRIRVVGGPGVTVGPKAPKHEAPGWLEQAQDGCKGHNGGN